MTGALILLAVGAAVLAIDADRAWSPKLRSKMPRFLLGLVRTSEDNRLSAITHFVAAAVVVDFLHLFLSMPKDPVLAAVMFSAWDDPAARTIGRSCHSPKIPGTGKTLAGTLGFFFVGGAAALLACLVLGAEVSLVQLGAGGVVAALIELYSRHWDNFTVPLFASLAMWVLI